MHRSGGRQESDSREISISFDGLARVDGSARLSFGDTTALASASGPIEVRLAAEQPARATFEVNIRPISNVAATEAKSLAVAVRAALSPAVFLHQYPRTLLQLMIQALSPARAKQDDGLLAAMINAGSLALLNAGSVAMRGVVCAVPVARISDGTSTSLVVDPDVDELTRALGSGCFAFLFSSAPTADCVWMHWRNAAGAPLEKDLPAIRDFARNGARTILAAMKICCRQMGSRALMKPLSSADIAMDSNSDTSDEEMDS
ncbi:3' exoribonuclease family, domain 1-domain-containing protein [Schizophyllum amplum]|uniref:3' exoribonuclease family, domain 1-domain-containing protein n=1 Tax=Schizophyllum amplum TaxID=97359 RepID=A0A550CDK7_9AGAR|nr:3' exoribonuclease family, domain 1-domain-containing protein [Auriculariopsis ampla]